MFEKVIIDKDLMDIRDAACKGELNAMCQLARHIINGDRTKLCIATVKELIEKITDHDDLNEEVEILKDTLKLMADYITESYRAEEIEYLEYVEGMQLSLQELIKISVQSPFNSWQVEELKYCIDWLYTAEIELAEYLDS